MKYLFFSLFFVLGLASTAPAQSYYYEPPVYQSGWSFGFGLYSRPPVYVTPPPVYVTPPPKVYVNPPPRVYVTPPPQHYHYHYPHGYYHRGW